MAVPEGYRVLSLAEQEEIKSRLSARGGALKPCEVCGAENWVVFPYVVSPRLISINKATGAFKEVDGNSLNQAAFSCTNCGNTKYLELHFIGFKVSDPGGST